MKKAVIYYHSKTGRTKYFGEEIEEFLKQNNIDTKIFSIYDAKPEQLSDADMVLLGCWTHGLFIVLQHPDSKWTAFAKALPDINGKKVALFTTYKLATGSMFSRMKKHLNGKIGPISLTLKSKTDKLSEEHKNQLLEFING